MNVITPAEPYIASHAAEATRRHTENITRRHAGHTYWGNAACDAACRFIDTRRLVTYAGYCHETASHTPRSRR